MSVSLHPRISRHLELMRRLNYPPESQAMLLLVAEKTNSLDDLLKQLEEAAAKLPSPSPSCVDLQQEPRPKSSQRKPSDAPDTNPNGGMP